VPGKRLTAKESPAKQASVGGPIVIVGVGHMGGAFARGLIAAGFGSDLILVDPAMKPADARAFRKSGAQTAGDADVLSGTSPCAVILAVKPQMMAAVAPAYAQAAKKAVVISIAAGTSIESLRLWLKSPSAIVRAMPNLPASIGKGISAAHATRGTTAAQKKLADRLLRALGDLVWLDGEELLNAVTAVSGSGPAYVFLLVEAIAAAAERVGLAPAIAKQLARKTIEGTGALLSTTEEEAADLRRSVTSPGGTTEAALKVLMASDRFQELLVDAIEAGTSRGFELAKTR
jgi:pyrroline-5-carboxylate reductase